MKIATHRGSILTKLGIGCVVCLLLGFGFLLYAQEEKKAAFIGKTSNMDAAKMKEMAAAKSQAMDKAPERSQPQRNRAWGGRNRAGGIDYGENEAFYQTIIDYNLFRPLGWTPPKNEPSYSLIGTKIVDSDSAASRATLLERRSNRYHFVTIGTKLDDMTVKEIQSKKVIMDKAGETITLNLSAFQPLTTKGRSESNRDGGRGEGGSESARNNNNTGQNRNNQANAEKRSQAEQKKREYSREQMRREAMEKLRNASSPEERREIMEWMRKEFGGDRGRRGRDR